MHISRYELIHELGLLAQSRNEVPVYRDLPVLLEKVAPALWGHIEQRLYPPDSMIRELAHRSGIPEGLIYLFVHECHRRRQQLGPPDFFLRLGRELEQMVGGSMAPIDVGDVATFLSTFDTRMIEAIRREVFPQDRDLLQMSETMHLPVTVVKTFWVELWRLRKEQLCPAAVGSQDCDDSAIRASLGIGQPGYPRLHDIHVVSDYVRAWRSGPRLDSPNEPMRLAQACYVLYHGARYFDCSEEFEFVATSEGWRPAQHADLRALFSCSPEDCLRWLAGLPRHSTHLMPSASQSLPDHVEFSLSGVGYLQLESLCCATLPPEMDLDVRILEPTYRCEDPDYGPWIYPVSGAILKDIARSSADANFIALWIDAARFAWDATSPPLESVLVSSLAKAIIDLCRSALVRDFPVFALVQ